MTLNNLPPELIYHSPSPYIHQLIIHRPARKNALNTALLCALAQACQSIAAQQGRVIIISGSEGNFAAGADIDEIATLNPQQTLLDARVSAWQSLRNCPIPLIAAIEGYCFGAGMELLLSCDFAIAHSQAQFALPEVKLGIMPGAGGTQILPRLIGTARAARMIYTGERFSAQTMLDWGVISDISQDPLSQAQSIAQVIAQNAPFAISQAKRSLRQAQETGLEDGMRFERQAFSLLAASADKQEGIAAFKEKRVANFHGK